MKYLLLALLITGCGQDYFKGDPGEDGESASCSVVTFGDETTGTTIFITCSDGSAARIVTTPGKPDKEEACRTERRNQRVEKNKQTYDVYVVCKDTEEYLSTVQEKKVKR